MTAASTPVRASVQEFQKPSQAEHPSQISVATVGKSTSVSQLRTDMEPRKETTISEFVLSVATKPVAPVSRELGRGKRLARVYLYPGKMVFNKSIISQDTINKRERIQNSFIEK